MKLFLSAIGGLAFACAPAAAAANVPEQLEQLEPGRGEVQAEYSVIAGDGEDVEHSVEAMVGINDRLAIGFELETETSASGIYFESVGPKLLYRFTGENAPVHIGIQVQVGFGNDASLEEAEVRLIADAQDEHWWAQANGMLRRSSGGLGTSTRAAYAWSLQHAVGDVFWLGLEGSGQSASIWGSGGAKEQQGHFLGPSLTLAIEPAPGREIELGLAALRRIGGEGPHGTLRAFVQISF